MLGPVADSSECERIHCRMTKTIQEGSQSLNFVDVQSVFRDKSMFGLMRSPPVLLRGMYKSTLRVALTEFHQAGRDERRRCRAWTLLLLLPRLLLFRPARGGLRRGSTSSCVGSGSNCSPPAKIVLTSQHHRWRTQTDTMECAEAFVFWENSQDVTHWRVPFGTWELRDAPHVASTPLSALDPRQEGLQGRLESSRDAERFWSNVPKFRSWGCPRGKFAGCSHGQS